MPILLAGGKAGLMELRDAWRALPCPLACPSMLIRDGRRFALIDEERHALWTGRQVMSVDSGIEAALFWRDCLLLLSGDTDCLTLMDLQGGMRLLTTRAGVYPQDMCLLPGGRLAAVCGGAEGTLRIIRVPELTLERVLHLPGSVQRVACAADGLLVLCAQEDDGLRCLMGRVPFGGGFEPLGTLPGLPGAVHVDGGGRWWAASSETLCRVDGGVPQSVAGDFGLIRHMDSRGGALLTADPVLGLLCVVKNGAARIVYEGDVRDAGFI